MSREVLQFDLDGFDFEAALNDVSKDKAHAIVEGALWDVAQDETADLEDRIRRMEHVISTGAGEIYGDFVDFGRLAAQMKMMCMHDHQLQAGMSGSITLSSFMGEHGPDDGHGHTADGNDVHEDSKDKKKKKKKTRGWFGVHR